MKSFWKNLSIFLIGALAGMAVFFKMKKPDVTNIAGNQVGTQKIKDNRKMKPRRSKQSTRRIAKQERKEARILKRKNKRLS